MSTSCIEKRYLTRINVLKFKEIISSKTQSKLRKLFQLIRNINYYCYYCIYCFYLLSVYIVSIYQCITMVYENKDCLLDIMYLRTNVMSSNPACGEMYSMQHYVIKFVSDLRQVGGFFRVLWFPP